MTISYLGRSTKLRRARSRRRALAALLATVALLAIPSTALAQQVSPTQDQYQRTEVVTGNPGDPGNPGGPSTSNQVGGLPFSGLDVGLLIAAAAVLGGSGLVLRRMSAADRR
jgi:hypothetical protein